MRSLYTAAKARGFVVVSYYDTRAATLAKHTLSGQALGGQQLDVHFSLPKDDREAVQVGARVPSLSLVFQRGCQANCDLGLIGPLAACRAWCQSV